MFSSHRRTSTGYHVACVSNLSKTENTSWTAKLQHGPNFRKESTLAQTGGTCGEKTRTRPLRYRDAPEDNGGGATEKRKDTSKVDGVHPKRFSCWLKSRRSTDTAMDVPGTPPLNLRVSHGTDSQLRRTCRTTLVKCNSWAQTTHANKACITHHVLTSTSVHTDVRSHILGDRCGDLSSSLFISPLSSLLSPLSSPLLSTTRMTIIVPSDPPFSSLSASDSYQRASTDQRLSHRIPSNENCP